MLRKFAEAVAAPTATLTAIIAALSCSYADPLQECLERYESGAYVQAVPLCRAARDVNRESMEVADALSDSLYRIFYRAWQDDGLRAALEAVFESYEVADEAGLREMTKRALAGLVTALSAIGDLERARAALKAQIELGLGPQETARALVAEGTMYLQEGKLGLAKKSLLDALELAPTGLEPTLYRSAYLNLALIGVRSGELEAAEAYVDSAAEYLDSGDDSSVVYYRALVWVAKGHYRRARPLVENLLERAHENNESDEWLWLRETLYGRLLTGLGEMTAAERALKAAVERVETLRRDVGLGPLRYWTLVERREPAERLFELYVDAGRLVDALDAAGRLANRSFVDAFARPPRRRPDALLRVQGALDDYESADRLRAVLSRMEESAVAEQRPAAEIVAESKDRASIAFVEAGDSIYRVTVADGKIEIVPIDAALDEVARLADDFHADPDDDDKAARLAELLLPRDRLPVGQETMVIVSSPSLEGVPWSALLYGGERLVELRSILLAPTLGSLPARSPRRGRQVDALVLGDPADDLPAGRDEALWVAQHLGVRPFLGEEAQVGLLLFFRGAPVIHLATHTGEDLAGPWALFREGPIPGSDLVAAGARARLVFLASCASAGKARDGLWGSLGAQLLAGGAEAVVGSLWAIEDEPTRHFVEGFYRNRGAEHPLRALRRTQIEMIAAGEPPSRWAPFVLLGTPRPPTGVNSPAAGR